MLAEHVNERALERFESEQQESESSFARQRVCAESTSKRTFMENHIQQTYQIDRCARADDRASLWKSIINPGRLYLAACSLLNNNCKMRVCGVSSRVTARAARSIVALSVGLYCTSWRNGST